MVVRKSAVVAGSPFPSPFFFLSLLPSPPSIPSLDYCNLLFLVRVPRRYGSQPGHEFVTDFVTEGGCHKLESVTPPCHGFVTDFFRTVQVVVARKHFDALDKLQTK